MMRQFVTEMSTYVGYVPGHGGIYERPVASFDKEVNPRLAKRPLKTNGRLANLEKTSFLKEATWHQRQLHRGRRMWL